MAIRITNDCNGCADCIGCRLKEPYKALFCDRCGDQVETLYITTHGDLCEYCALDSLECCTTEDIDE